MNSMVANPEENVPSGAKPPTGFSVPNRKPVLAPGARFRAVMGLGPKVMIYGFVIPLKIRVPFWINMMAAESMVTELGSLKIVPNIDIESVGPTV